MCPIPGTTKVENFNQNIGALSLKLTPECWNYGSLLEWWLYYWNGGYTIEKVAHYWNGGYTIGMVAILLKWWL